MNPKLHRPVCDLLGCRLPIVLAGMGGVARSDLVVAATRAGGFGFLGMVRESPALIKSEVEKVRAATAGEFGVNLIPAATKPDLLNAEIAAVLELRVPVVALFWDIDPEVVRRLRAAGVLVVYQIGSVEEARQAEAAGAQILIAQGVEAGGHVRALTPRNELVSAVVRNASVPVLAAGGIVSGAQVVEALSLGAQGVVLGTALLATTESFAHDFHKQSIVGSRAGETILTQAFHVNWPRGANVRVLPNAVTRGEMGDPFTAPKQVIGKEGERNIWLFSTDSPQKNMTGEFELMALYAGAGSGAIAEVVPAGERIAAIMAEAEAALGRGTAAIPEDEAQGSTSPVCYAREMDDTYAGFASSGELIAFCNLLLEAERAGARITARMSVEASDPARRDLLRSIQHDESSYCAMLRKWISHFGGEASDRIGDFYGKCLAIADPDARLGFLNRGQGWVARKIREMLPKIRDDAMHADLKDMLEVHEANIARAEEEREKRSE